MQELAIFLPTYKRPETLDGVAKNIEETTSSPFTLYFGLEPDDKAGIKSAKATGHKVIVNKYPQGYSNTIQTIYEASDEPIFFHANDDFRFLPEWDKAPMQMLKDDSEIMVLGAHDGNDSPTFLTISFIRRKYIEQMSGVIDMPNRVFYPYKHNFQDTEFSQTAQFRGIWNKCTTPCIDHMNPGLPKWKHKQSDETYEKNNKTIADDSNTYSSRTHLWGK